MEARLRHLFDEYPTPDHTFLMNIIIWNCRGALKPSFQNRVRELVHNHNLAIFVVMETWVGGDGAKGKLLTGFPLMELSISILSDMLVGFRCYGI